MDLLKINCHILNKKGEFETILCYLNAPYTASELLKNKAIVDLISNNHKVFVTPTSCATDDACLQGLTEIFILSKARISPQEWRQNRLKVAKALLKKVP